MAAGDAAAAAGLPTVAGTADLRESYTEHNTTRDLLAGQMSDGTIDAAAIISGIIAPARLPVSPALTAVDIPALPASKITSGVLDSGRIPNFLEADRVGSSAYARNATGTAPWYNAWFNSDRQLMRNTSAKRYKKNIRDWPRGLTAVLGLRPVIFDRRGDKTPDNEVGFIAEEVNEHIPEAVVYFDDEIDGLDERAIIAALVGSVQELAHRITELEQTSKETP
jgi:hypothetical protein